MHRVTERKCRASHAMPFTRRWRVPHVHAHRKRLVLGCLSSVDTIDTIYKSYCRNALPIVRTENDLQWS